MYRRQKLTGKYFNLIIFFVFFVTSISLGLYLKHTQWLSEKSETLSYFGYCAIALSVIMAGLQFRSNNIWRKKEKAYTVAQEAKKEIEPNMALINQHFHFYQRKLTDANIAISLEEIHDKICLKDVNGKLVAANSNSSMKYILDPEEGAQIRSAIVKTLNTFEYIASGVRHDAFDEEVINSLFEGLMIKFYKVFKNYIDHYRNDMHPSRKNKIWIHFTCLAREFEEKCKKEEL